MFTNPIMSRKRRFIIVNAIYLLLVTAVVLSNNEGIPSIERVQGEEKRYTITLDETNPPPNLSSDVFGDDIGFSGYVDFNYHDAKRLTGVHIILDANGSLSNHSETQITSMKTITATFSGSSAALSVGASLATMGSPQSISSATPITLSDNPYFFTFTNSGTTELLLTSLVITYSCIPYYSTISYDTNSGSVINPMTQVIGSVLIAPSAPTKPGHTFQGWYLDASLMVPYTFTTMPEQSLTVYAKWSANTYTITLDVNGGSMREETMLQVTYGQPYTLPVPTPAEGDFVGWYLDSHRYTDELGASLQNYAVSSDITLIAMYEIVFIDIASAAQLDDIRDNLDANYRLVADIDLLGVAWIPLGNNESPFTGIFDGQNHTINHLTMSPSHIIYFAYYGGLFGYSTGTIRNLTLTNVDIHISGGMSTQVFAGAIVGYTTGLVENVHALSGSIYAKMITGVDGYLGGIIGYLYQATVSMESITNYLTVTSENISYTGGIIGYSLYANITLIDVDNFGNVIGHEMAGGLIAYAESSPTSISSCKNEGVIDGADYNGGLIGRISGNATITNSQNYGAINGSNYAGGLMGYSRPSSNITNSDNYADISAANYGGGLIGLAEGATITDSSNTADLVLANMCAGGLVASGTANISSSYNTSDLSGGTYVGGIIGKVDYNMTINDCYNLGYIGGGTSVGGLVGYVSAWNFTMSDCYNGGTVHAATDYAGGLIGNADASWGNTYLYTSVNFGDVIVNATTSNIGGIIGGTPPGFTRTDNYYYCDITSNNVAVAGTIHGTKVVEVSTFNQAFFTTTLTWSTEVWDFSQLDVATASYPALLT